MNKTPNTSRESVPQIPMEQNESSLRKLRVRVAELCGWRYPLDRSESKPPYEMNEPSALRYKRLARTIPDYCNDLNACAAFEKTMTEDQGVQFRLCLMFNSDGPRSTFRSVEAALCHATAEQRCRAFVAVMESAPSVPSLTEALTTSGVSAKPEEEEDFGKPEPPSETVPTGLMEVLQQALEVLLYLPGWPNKTIAELRTQSGDEELVEDHQIERDKRSVIEQIQRHLSEHRVSSPAISVPASPDSPPSPSPLVSVEEWTELREDLIQLAHICTCKRPTKLLSGGGVQAPGDHTSSCVSVVANHANASLASLTSRLEEAERMPRVERCVSCNSFVSDWIDTDESHGRMCRPCETISSLRASLAVAEADREILIEALTEAVPLLEIVRDYEPGGPDGACAANRARILCEHFEMLITNS